MVIQDDVLPTPSVSSLQPLPPDEADKLTKESKVCCRRIVRFT